MMKQGILIILAACALSDAMVPLERRSLESSSQAPVAAETAPEKICAATTQCGWKVNGNNQYTTYIENTFCKCGPGTECVEFEADTNNNDNTIIFRCQTPHHGHHDTTHS